MHLDGRFAGDDRDGLLLGVVCVHLQDLQMGGPRSDRVNYEAENCAGTVYARGVGLPRGGHHHFSALRVDALHNGNLLIAARQESAVTDFFDLNDRGIVMHQQRYREQIADIRDRESKRRRIARF